MNPESSPFFEPVSTFDTVIINFSLLTPWLGVAAAVILGVAILALTFATREPGRIEILLGAAMFAAQFIFLTQWQLASLGGGLVHAAWIRILLVLPLALLAVGFARLSHAAIRRRRASPRA
jgi:hypothetical protein